MGSWNQFVGSYNSRKADEVREREARNRERQEAFEAREQSRKDLKARRKEIADLVCRTFWAVDRKYRRNGNAMIKAYATADSLARIGGEDYAEAVKALRFAFTGPAAYADACAACLIGVND